MGLLQKWWEQNYPNAAVKKVVNVSDGVLGLQHLINFEKWLVENKHIDAGG